MTVRLSLDSTPAPYPMPRVLALAFVLFVVASVALAGPFTGKVVGVSDGDTITGLSAGRTVKVRLAGIDCPEKGQPFGARAKQYTSEAAFGTLVTVIVRDRDRYGRSVGDVVLMSGNVLNRDLVRAGLAWWYRKYAPKDRELERLEVEARAARRGLWSESRPVPPWDWRRPVSR